MKWGKKSTADPASAQQNNESTSPKEKRVRASFVLPDMTTLVYGLGILIMLGVVSILGASVALPSMVSMLVYATLVAALLTSVVCVFGVSAGN